MFAGGGPEEMVGDDHAAGALIELCDIIKAFENIPANFQMC